MVVGIGICELHLPAVRSLKGKRKIVKSLVERIHARHRVSVAETDHHDLHQRSEISVAIVGNRESEVLRRLEDIRSLYDGEFDAMVTRWDPQILESQ